MSAHPDSAPRRDSASDDLAQREPAPDDPRKPDSPTSLKKRTWMFAARKAIREFSTDQCTDLAAGLTYYAVLALFPSLIAVFSLLGVIGQGQATAEAVLGVVSQVAPDAAETLEGPITAIANSQAAGFALVTGIVVAIWSASGYVGAFSRAMNRIYDIHEGRPVWKLKPVQLMVTLIAVLCIAIAGILLAVTGSVARAIGDVIGLGDAAVITWQIARWPVLAFIVVFVVAILYHFGPNVRQPKFRWISVGAVVAIVVLAVAGLGFGFYVSNFSNYDKTYGSLAGVIVFLLLLWIANNALLFGAEVDAEVERSRQLQAGIDAEERIQLPPRDTAGIEKAEKAEQKDLAEAHRIRLEVDTDDDG